VNLYLPTPTCTHHQTTEIQCLTCRGTMRLVTIEPGVQNFELRRYACPHCDSVESFLMSIGSPAAVAGPVEENSGR
jgi:transposase-like protein